ncbi:hypothetical protein QBC41DRAFT_37361 [Cercophora samala]|uniref:Secreted protein n=1 Tax=Cercophora samala TaxID=330535 RepID=A0AA40D318_9PEZI|nr:hypothetical protein QBC41DRAFT_37361 [Cercophora samala]
MVHIMASRFQHVAWVAFVVFFSPCLMKTIKCNGSEILPVPSCCPAVARGVCLLKPCASCRALRGLSSMQLDAKISMFWANVVAIRTLIGDDLYRQPSMPGTWPIHPPTSSCMYLD